MSKFIVKKHIALGFLGEGWEEAYVDFSPFTFKDNDTIIHLRKLATTQAKMEDSEIKQASTDIMEILADKFIGGMGYNGKELEPITKDNLNELPMEIIVHILQTLQGQGIVPKNA
jgi:hypothetical protein